MNWSIWVYQDQQYGVSLASREMASKATRVAGSILKSYCSRNPAVLRSAFRSFVLPILSYASPAWNSTRMSDIKLLERNQRRFTKHLRSLKNLTYQEKLDILSASKLSIVHQRADLIFTLKCIHGLVDCSINYMGLQLCRS